LDQICIPLENLDDLARYSMIDVETWRQKDGVRTPLEGRHRWHCRMDAKLSRFIGAGSNHASFVRLTTNDDWFSAQLGTITLLNCCIECIHVNMNNLANVLSHSCAACSPRNMVRRFFRSPSISQSS